jgi:restriction system protein
VTVPDFQTVMLPLLRLAADGEEHSLRSAVDRLANEFHLSGEDRAELLPSGGQARFDNRVGWARTYMKKAGLLEFPRRGYFKITGRGREALKQDPAAINVKFLERYPEFLEFRARSSGPKAAKPTATESEAVSAQQPLDPLEAMETAYEAIRGDLVSELLEQVMRCSPDFFERLVVDLLVRMGYGGTRKDAGRAVGKSGDGGIDGIINEDRLGLEVVYIQAKRWKEVVGRPEIQKFVGALRGRNARKGVFITTSSFSKGATDYAGGLQDKVVLVDGETLANLMADYGVGVSLERAYEVKRVDSDYFDEV